MDNEFFIEKARRYLESQIDERAQLDLCYVAERSNHVRVVFKLSTASGEPHQLACKLDLNGNVIKFEGSK